VEGQAIRMTAWTDKRQDVTEEAADESLEPRRKQVIIPYPERDLGARLNAGAFHTRSQVFVQAAGTWSKAFFRGFRCRDQLGALTVAAVEILAVWNVK
jgi:hypothetical protein